MHAGLQERKEMAAAFAKLPLKVLWKLSKSEVPDEAALADLKIGSNTKVQMLLPLAFNRLTCSFTI